MLLKSNVYNDYKCGYWLWKYNYQIKIWTADMWLYRCEYSHFIIFFRHRQSLCETMITDRFPKSHNRFRIADWGYVLIMYYYWLRTGVFSVTKFQHKKYLGILHNYVYLIINQCLYNVHVLHIINHTWIIFINNLSDKWYIIVINMIS